MKVILAPHIPTSLGTSTAPIAPPDLDRYVVADVPDESTSTLSETVGALIRSNQELVVGAAPQVDAPPFTDQYWWPALLVTAGDKVSVEAFPLGRSFGIDGDGRVQFQYPRDLPIADLVRAIDDGHYPASEHTLVITRTGEFGGNGHPITSLVLWLLQEFPAILLGAGVDRLILRGDNHKQEELEKLAADWAGRHVTYLHVLRRYVETRRAWYPDRLAQRLAISPQAARRLLEALGYEASPNDETLLEWSVSDLAQRLRQRWTDAESAVTFTTLDELLESDDARPQQPNQSDWFVEAPHEGSWWTRFRARVRGR